MLFTSINHRIHKAGLYTAMGKALATMILAISPYILWAQGAANGEVSKTVEVLREYTPSVKPVFKINQIPRLDDTLQQTTNFTYQTKSVKPLADTYLVNPIPPAKVQKERYVAPETFSGYMRLGAGYVPGTLLDAYIGGTTSRSVDWGMQANHYGLYGKVKNDVGTRVPTIDMRNNIGMQSKFALENSLIDINLGYRHHMINYYGFDTAFTLDQYKALSRDETHQLYNKSHINLDYQLNNFPDTTWNFATSALVYDYRANLSRAEDRIYLRFGGLKQFRPESRIGATLDADLYVRSASLARHSNYVFGISPYLLEQHDEWEAKVGASLVLSSNGKTKVFVYPDLSITFNLLDGYLYPYMSLTGRQQVNSFESLTSENPYIHPSDTLNFQNSSFKAIFRGGIKGRISAIVSYHLWLGYSFIDRLYYYNNVYGQGYLGNYFDMEYHNTQLLTARTEWAITPSKDWDFEVVYNYDKYTLDKDPNSQARPQALHRPQHYLITQARYNFRNKIATYANLGLRGSYQAMNSQAQLITRKAGADLSIGAQYNFVSGSSAFVQLNNLFAVRYHEFSNYNTYGFNMLVGYAFSF